MTIPLYDPLVPQFPSDSFATSQPELQNNFQRLFDAFLVNHVSLDAGASAGNHSVVELLEQLGPLQTNVSEINVYTKDVEGQTDQLFMRFQGNGQEIQFTNYQIYSLGTIDGQEQYFSFLPGKIIIYFGSYDNTKIQGSLKLNPPVAKNIITVSLCPSGIRTGHEKPFVQMFENTDGIFRKIAIRKSPGGDAPKLGNYFVAANI